MHPDEKRETAPLYVKQDGARSDRVWHIVPPDPAKPGQLYDATWCGRYVIGHDILTTVRPGDVYTCKLCQDHQANGVLRNPVI